MTWLEAIVLALIQGITEFLPVSSSAHLILVPVLSGWRDQGIDFDVIVHAGSLVAILIYFRREITAMIRDWVLAFAGGGQTANSRLGWWVIIATLPTGIAGFLLKDHAAEYMRDPFLIGVGLIGFGLLLGVVDWNYRGTRDEHSLTLMDVLIIGFAQMLALFPGTSRSGITMTVALYRGLSREAASRFSFLLAVPIIAAATLLATRDLASSEVGTNWSLLALGFIVSAVSTYAVVHGFLAFIRRIGMQPFVAYRILLGLALIYFFR